MAEVDADGQLEDNETIAHGTRRSRITIASGEDDVMMIFKLIQGNILVFSRLWPLKLTVKRSYGVYVMMGLGEGESESKDDVMIVFKLV